MMAEDRGTAAPRQLDKPTLEDARLALQRLYGPHLGDVWVSLLRSAGLTGAETDLVSFDRLVNTMNGGDPITRICGRGLQLRSAAFARLSAAVSTEGKPA
jgi:hypothetical protein